MLAHALARTLGLAFHRIQFTSDMLPADIVGVVGLRPRDAAGFKFHPGPIFAQVILADEVNRATPKTQSALLEAMEEHQVTTEGETRALPEPFFVIATQNPLEQVGTFPLPESQLDRFLMRLELGYPDRDAERALLGGSDRRDMLATLEPVMTPAELIELQGEVEQVHVAPALLDYVQALVEHTRRAPDYVAGLSPRAALALLHAARAWAYVEGRDKVIPEDVQAVLPGVSPPTGCAGARQPAPRRCRRAARRRGSDSLSVRARRISPTVAAVRQVASSPATIDFMPSATISPRRAGHIVASPPIMMPRLPKLAKPHSA